MAWLGGHERVVDAGWHAGWGDPVDGGEEVEGDFAFDVEVEVYAAHFVENEIPNHV